jgi:hypothetical protein
MNRIEAAMGAAQISWSVTMRVLVCGGRDYSDQKHMFDVLSRFHAETPISALIHGAAQGADRMAATWAKIRGIVAYAYPASWSDISHPDALIRTTASGRPYDARAGYRRNQIMLERGKPNMVLAFSGGRGTLDMIKRAQAAGLTVKRV